MMEASIYNHMRQHVEVTMSEVETILNTFKNTKSQEQDGQQNKLLKYGGEKLTKILYRIFNSNIQFLTDLAKVQQF